MKVYSSEDIQALIDALPQNSENTHIYNALCAMKAEQAVIRQPYSFEVDFATTITQGATNLFPAPTAAGGTSTGNFLVDTSAPFMLVSSQYQADVAGAAVTLTTRPSPNVVCNIQDQSSNRNWMNGPVPIPSIFGIGQLPYFWPQPRLLPANTNVQIQLTNYDAASVPNIRLTFSGYRLYSIAR